VLVVGVTYKKDVRDLRKSPSIDMIDIFQKKGVSVAYHDPLIPYLKLNGINLKSMPIDKHNLRKFDCVVIATDHSVLDYGFILKNARLVFDARNVYQGRASGKVVRL